MAPYPINANIHSNNENKGNKNNTNQREKGKQFPSQKLFTNWILLWYTSTEFHSNLIIKVPLAHATPVYFFCSISYLIAGLSLDESNAFVHLYWWGVWLMIFYIINTHSLFYFHRIVLGIWLLWFCASYYP